MPSNYWQKPHALRHYRTIGLELEGAQVVWSLNIAGLPAFSPADCESTELLVHESPPQSKQEVLSSVNHLVILPSPPRLQ